MGGITNSEQYEAWYHTPRGRWVGDCEFKLMMDLLRPKPGLTLLDVGCGTGYFSRCFSKAGLRVTGLDADNSVVNYAHTQDGVSRYLVGSMLDLPFEDAAFDYCAAVTSLCFVASPEVALREMWRVSRHGIVLGLLNRYSLLFLQKHERGGYRGGRWDRLTDVIKWSQRLSPPPKPRVGTAITFPKGGGLAQLMERAVPMRFPWGGFLAVALLRE